MLILTNDVHRPFWLILYILIEQTHDGPVPVSRVNYQRVWLIKKHLNLSLTFGDKFFLPSSNSISLVVNVLIFQRVQEEKHDSRYLWTESMTSKVPFRLSRENTISHKNCFSIRSPCCHLAWYRYKELLTCQINFLSQQKAWLYFITKVNYTLQ